MRDQFQMLRVAAQSLVAQVIHLFLSRYVAEVMGVGHEMCGDSLTIETHATIATTSTIA